MFWKPGLDACRSTDNRRLFKAVAGSIRTNSARRVIKGLAPRLSD